MCGRGSINSTIVTMPRNAPSPQCRGDIDMTCHPEGLDGLFTQELQPGRIFGEPAAGGGISLWTYRETASLKTAHAEGVSPLGLSRRVPNTRAIVSRARIPSADRRDRPSARAFGPVRVFPVKHSHVFL